MIKELIYNRSLPVFVFTAPQWSRTAGSQEWNGPLHRRGLGGWWWWWSVVVTMPGRRRVFIRHPQQRRTSGGECRDGEPFVTRANTFPFFSSFLLDHYCPMNDVKRNVNFTVTNDDICSRNDGPWKCDDVVYRTLAIEFFFYTRKSCNTRNKRNTQRLQWFQFFIHEDFLPLCCFEFFFHCVLFCQFFAKYFE